MIIDNKWELIRSVFAQAFNSCMHYAMATVNEDGSPHVTPIGALILREDRTGYFFDEYCTRTRDNLNSNPRACFLAVNADKAFWGKSLADGKFASPPAIRISGTVRAPREATGEEIAAWQNHVAFARGTRGYEIMWSRMHIVRDVLFDSLEPVEVAAMTDGLL
jgi:uncharacterized protein